MRAAMVVSAAVAFLQQPALVPTYCKKVSTIPLDTEDEHAAACNSADCTRCFFWKAYHGFARQGKAAGSPVSIPDAGAAWKNRFTFYHPPSQRQVSWVSTRPVSWGGPFAICCWLCNTVYAPSPSSW